MTYPNKTAAYFCKISNIVFFLGFPNIWIEDLKCSKIFYKSFRRISQCLNVMVSFFLVFEIGAFFTQKSLTSKQETDLIIFAIAHPTLWSYNLILCRNDGNIKKLFSYILNLKNLYNNEEVEKEMLKKSKIFSTALGFTTILVVASNTIPPLIQYIKSEGTFTTVIAMWPLVDDPSRIAHFARVIINLLWWVFASRVIASYVTIIVLLTNISYQYINLQNYFYSIETIFNERNLEQHAKEIIYEKSFKLGIKMHLSTVECVNQLLHICKAIFSAQIVFVAILLVFLMTQLMKSERTMANAVAIGSTATAVLITTGFFFWNAGDITAEADKLPAAMYSSGWHNCYGESTIRVRKLVMIAMIYAQRPVVIKCLWMIEMSYKTYVTLVKTAYSVFSVIY